MTIRVYSEHVEPTAGALSFYNTLSNSFCTSHISPKPIHTQARGVANPLPPLLQINNSFGPPMNIQTLTLFNNFNHTQHRLL